MSTQRTDSVELDTAVASELCVESESLAASIPPELFKNILASVGDDVRLADNRSSLLYSDSKLSVDPDVWREEMKHLSACALTCVYWAQMTRERMFRLLVLRSSKDMSGLLSLLRAPQTPRIPPICSILRYLNVYYALGDHPWFHNLAGLERSYRVSNLAWINLYITGPARPAFATASTQGSVLHPLFFAAPRVLPVVVPTSCDVFLYISSIHLPNLTVLSNLIQDCLSLQLHYINCTNLTWDQDPVLQATPSSIGLKYAHRTAYGCWNVISKCTDNVLVAAMLKSVPHHEAFRRRQGPDLSPLETAFLFDVMRTTWHGLSPELERTEEFRMLSDSDSGYIQARVAVRLPTGTDFSLQWTVHDFEFRCIASRLPHAPATSNDVRNVTYIIIELQRFGNHHKLRRDMKTANIDWDTFLHAVRQFPHLRQIVIQWTSYLEPLPHQMLTEFLAHLGGAWFSLDGLLGLYYSDGGWDEVRWVQLRLDTSLDEIKQTGAKIKAEADAEKAASSELESGVSEEGGSITDLDLELRGLGSYR